MQGEGGEIMMRWRVKSWNIVDKISSLKLSLLQLHMRLFSISICLIDSTWVEVKNVCFYVLYLKVLIIYYAKDLWRFFESLDTFLLQHASESFTAFTTTIEAWSNGREIYQTSIFPFSFASNLLEGIFHLTTEMSLRQIHIYLGMKWNTSPTREAKK